MGLTFAIAAADSGWRPLHVPGASIKLLSFERDAAAFFSVAHDCRKWGHREDLGGHDQLGAVRSQGFAQDPFAFAKTSPWETLSRQARMELFLKHIDKFRQTWPNGERAVHTLNKFCKIYINGFDGAKELREQFMQANSADELYNLVAQAG